MSKRKSPVRRTLSDAMPSEGPRSRRRRTPPLGTNLVRPVQPSGDAQAWMNRARILIVSLEEAIQAGGNDPSLVASVETAFAAWEVTRTEPAVVARVAHLVSRAHEAIRTSPRPMDDQAVRGCAHILYAGLPASARDRVNFPKIVSLVQGLPREPESWVAVVKATSEILGWTGVALTHAGHVIRVAMATRIEPLG